MRLTVPLLLCLASVACAPVQQAPEPITVAPGVTLTLPSPADLGRRVEAVQLVSARRDGDVQLFEVRLSADRDRVLLVGTDTVGRRVMSIEWRDQGVVAERAAGVPGSLRPENVLADIVMLYWPEQAVRRAVLGAALTQDGGGRTIGEVIRVSWDGDPWSGRARLANASFGYELDIRSTLVSP